MRPWTLLCCLLLVPAPLACSPDDRGHDVPQPLATDPQLDATASAAAGEALPPDKPLYAMDEAETERFIRHMQRVHTDLRDRSGAIARANLEQPYEIYLLGEAPFETIDAQPIYCLDRSDCVTFVEHTLAMALTHDWDSFLAMLQRIRYIDGHISLTSRNHYTEGDWNPNNQWLARDVSRELAGEAAATYPLRIDRARFFRDRYDLDVEMPVEQLEVDYVPLEAVQGIASQLEQGDIVQFVRGRIGDDGQPGGLWIGHFGMVVRAADGSRNVIHSAAPRVREQTLTEIVDDGLAADREPGKVRLIGLTFLRLNEDALSALEAIDGADAPRVTLPDGAPFNPADVPLNPPTTRPATAAGG